MMRDLSMHIMDIVQNSISAGARKIEIVVEDPPEASEFFLFSVKDDGCGMDEEMVKKVRDPFSTSRTTRKVGLGIPMLEQTCTQCGGELELKSEVGIGTYICAKMCAGNMDRPPLGDIANTVLALAVSNEDLDIIFKQMRGEKEYVFDTAQIKEILEGVPFSEPEILGWLKENLVEGVASIYREED